MTGLMASLAWEPLQLPEEFAARDLLGFRRVDALPRYEISNPGPGDQGDCLRLFELAFGEPANERLWDWKYGDGRGVSMIARREGRLVAHYGCASREILCMGKPTRAVQICDVMVDPAERGIMSRRGAFLTAARASQQCIIGLENQHVCGFGFPNQRHMVLGERADLYREVESMVELSWPLDASSSSLFTSTREIRVKTASSLIQRLWQEMARDLSEGLVGVRDAEYLHHRYENHPKFGYRIFLIRRRWGTPLGLVVLRLEGSVCRLMDLVGPLRNANVLVSHARRIAGTLGADNLLAWITSCQAHWLENTGEVRSPLDIKIPGNCFVQRIPVDQLKNRWWLMMGDTDFL